MEKEGKCKYGHCSPMGNAAWTDLNGDHRILKLLDMCDRSGCKCQKKLTFSTKEFMFEGGLIRSKLMKLFKGSEKAWNKFLKPGGPYIGMAVAAKSRNPQVAQATANVLKNISGDKVFHLTDMYGQGLRLRVR